MVIEIELFGQLSKGKQRRRTLNLDQTLDVQGIAVLLGLNLEEIGLITINGVQSEMEDSVQPGCRLCFFPYLSGG